MRVAEHQDERGDEARLVRGAELSDGPRDIPSASAWYVVTIKRHCDGLARARLAERAIESYLPLTVEWPPPAVGRQIQPLFPGYLFVRAALPADFYRVTRTRGVKGFVAFGDAPPSVSGGCIEFLRAHEGPDGVIPCAEGAPAGVDVRVVDGPFKGVTAVVARRLPARERVVVLLNVLKRETPVELPERWLKRA